MVRRRKPLFEVGTGRQGAIRLPASDDPPTLGLARRTLLQLTTDNQRRLARVNKGARRMNSIQNYSSAPMRVSPFGLRRISGVAVRLRALQLLLPRLAREVP